MGKNTSQIQWSEEEAVKVIMLRIFVICSYSGGNLR